MKTATRLLELGSVLRLPPSDTRDVLAITDRLYMAISLLRALSTLENVLSHVLEHPNPPNLTLTYPNLLTQFNHLALQC
jgi:hypothetical protein